MIVRRPVRGHSDRTATIHDATDGRQYAHRAEGSIAIARQPGSGVFAGMSPSPVVTRPGAIVMLLVAAVVAAFAVSRQPLYAVGAVLAIALAWLVAQRLWLAVSLLVASSYFEGYLAVGLGVLTVSKLVGVLAMVAWFLAWSRGRQPITTVGLFWPVAGLAAWILLSLAMAYDQSAAVLFASRYLMFFVLVFLVVQTVNGQLSRATQLAKVAVASAALAALIGLWNFFGGAERAIGPLDDPNDFGFLLAVTVPLAMHQFQIASRPARRCAAALALASILAGTLATFSRGAIIGLAVAGAFSLLTRRLRTRWAPDRLGDRARRVRQLTTPRGGTRELREALHRVRASHRRRRPRHHPQRLPQRPGGAGSTRAGAVPRIPRRLVGAASAPHP
jgi:hypothetical protein